MSDLNVDTAEREIFEDYLICHQFVRGQTVRLDFVVIRIVGNNGVPDGVLIYEHVPDRQQNWDCNNPAEADVFMEGDIKFDGESNWDFPNAPRCMIQFGDMQDAMSLGRLMERCYRIAAERIASFDREYGLNEGSQPAPSST